MTGPVVALLSLGWKSQQVIRENSVASGEVHLLDMPPALLLT